MSAQLATNKQGPGPFIPFRELRQAGVCQVIDYTNALPGCNNSNLLPLKVVENGHRSRRAPSEAMRSVPVCEDAAGKAQK
jgi:hypothetical protein